MNSVCLGKDTALILGRSQQLSVALMGVNLTMDACRRPGAAVCKLARAELKLGIKDGLNACCYICIFSFTVNKFEVKCLISLFYNLVGDVTERQGVVVGLDRNAFRNILHVTFGMTDDMIMDRGRRAAVSGCPGPAAAGKKDSLEFGHGLGRKLHVLRSQFHLNGRV